MRKNCSKCSKDFVCLESPTCWCYLIDERFEIQTDIHDCMCRDCLLMPPAEMNIAMPCKEHRWSVGVIDANNDLVIFECTVCHFQHELRGIFT
jgi:hypothetical protein